MKLIKMFLISTIWYQLLMVYAFCEVKVNMDVISQIESSGNPNAINHSSGARGLCGLTYGALVDWNNQHKTKYKMDDLYNPDINMEIASWYMNEQLPTYFSHYEIEDTLDNRLAAYNWGFFHLAKHHKMPKETRNYIIKYHLIEKELSTRK